MSQIDTCPAVHTRFSEYKAESWETLKSQVLDRYGPIVLDKCFDIKYIPENRRYWVDQFRQEYFHRQSITQQVESKTSQWGSILGGGSHERIVIVVLPGLLFLAG